MNRKRAAVRCNDELGLVVVYFEEVVFPVASQIRDDLIVYLYL